MSEPIWCALAYKGLTLKVNRSVAPCCGLRDWHTDIAENTEEVFYQANGKQIQELRKSLMNGEYPSYCRLCKEQEEQGLHSMRVIWNYFYDSLDRPKTMSHWINPKDLFTLDINTGKKCNSKCMTCVPSLSDFWEEEYNEIYSDVYITKPDALQSKEECDKLVDMATNIRKITFSGGEPTITKINQYVLERLIETGRSRDIHLSYTTNLTGITEELIKLWKKFPTINLNMSIDGFGPVNEYIRYPFKWEKISDTVDRVLELTEERKFSCGISMTSSVFNALRTHELIEYWWKRNKNRDTANMFVNIATYPLHVNASILSTEYRARALEPLLELQSKIQKEPRYEILHNTIQCMVNHLQVQSDPDLKQIRELKRFIKKSDAFRNRSIKDYIPELAEELEKYE